MMRSEAAKAFMRYYLSAVDPQAAVWSTGVAGVFMLGYEACLIDHPPHEIKVISGVPADMVAENNRLQNELAELKWRLEGLEK